MVPPSLTKIPECVILPDTKAKLLYGIAPVIFERKHMTSLDAWLRFSVFHDAYLNEFDFVDKDMFARYWYLSIGLLEYPVVLFNGDPGTGKSLGLSRLSYDLSRLFGKTAVLDQVPPNPQKFGKFVDLNDQDLIDKIQNEANRLESIEKRYKMEGKGKIPPNELSDFIIYNSFFGLDEGDKWCPKNRRDNTAKLIGRLVNRRRHFYMGMGICFINIEQSDKALIYDNLTHTVNCYRDAFPKAMPGWCSYQYRDCRRGGTGLSKWLHLNPEDNLEIWDSHNIVGVSHNLEVYLGGQKKPKLPKEPIGGMN